MARGNNMTQFKGHLSNEFQGQFKKVLCVCTAGMLRSPTIAHTLSAEPYNFNTRCAGTNDRLAVVELTDRLLLWADEVVCADTEHAQVVTKRLGKLGLDTRVVNLRLPDIYDYRDPELVESVKTGYDNANN
jgi:predicted protein tyrosine phosphatase